MKTPIEITKMKGKEKISMLTCYDYSFAKALDGNVDIILVGDSLGNVVLGYERTKHVSMDDMIRHTEAVARGTKHTHIVGDMPHGSYNENNVLENAKRFLKAGAHSVKIEGNPEIVKLLVKNNIPTMAHLGLLPQTAEKLGVVGREEKEAEQLIEESKKMEQAGAYSLVLESIPSELAEKVTKEISIPTIGIGAGKEVDGQVLVLYDLIGLFPDFKPKFVRPYLNLKEDIKKAVNKFTDDVKKDKFPSEEESFK